MGACVEGYKPVPGIAIHDAACKGNTEEFQTALKDADLFATADNGDNILHCIIRGKNIDILNELIAKFKDNQYAGLKKLANTYKKEGLTSLQLALTIKKKNLEFVKRLVPISDTKKAAGAQQYSQTALHLAAVEADIDIIRQLLPSKGVKAFINQQDDRGQTALHITAGSNLKALDIVQLFIEQGGGGPRKHRSRSRTSEEKEQKWENTMIEDDSKKIPLHCAAYAHYHEICKLLLQYDDKGNTLQKQDNEFNNPIRAAIYVKGFIKRIKRAVINKFVCYLPSRNQL